MKTNYIVKQNDLKDCGICCLESIIKYYNGYIPLETLRYDTKTNENGTTAYNLIKTAKKYGFNAIGSKINNLNRKDISLPAIAHITTKRGLDHFVVIYKISKNKVSIMDPAKGFVKRDIKDFEEEWNNIILIFKPYKKIPLIKLKHSIKSLFIECISNEYKLIVKIIIFSIIITILSIISSYYIKITISQIESSYITTILFTTLLFLILNILKIYFSYLKNNISIYLNKNIDLKIIPNFINHIFNLPLNAIKSRTTGEILTRIQELNEIKNLFSEIIIEILLDIFLILTSSIFLYYISKELFFILCIISLLYVVIGIITRPFLNRKINDSIDLETELNGALTENIDSLETIKNLNMVNKKIIDIENKYVDYQYNYFYFSKFMNMINTINTSIYEIGIFFITTYGIFMITNNKLSLLSLITFNSLLSYFIEPIKSTIDILPKYYHIKASFNKISEFINIEPEKIGKKETFINGDIKIENVSYSYDDYNNILSKVNLTIKENDHLTIKGASGCGKSTLFKMLSNNINDYKGNIYIENINIKDYSLNTLRSNILYVSQKEKLFTDTILNNITMKKYVNQKELNDVLRITKVDEIIKNKSFRLETFLFDSGNNLSGGERQRIILARSIIYKPKILILDESLSELDRNLESKILKEIDNYLANTTIIYISHTNTSCFSNEIEMSNLYDK